MLRLPSSPSKVLFMCEFPWQADVLCQISVIFSQEKPSSDQGRVSQIH